MSWRFTELSWFRSSLFSAAPLSSFPINHLLLKYKSTLSSLVLRCETCNKDYSSQESSRTPRVHLTCGHTSCEACVEMDSLRYGQVACLTCGAMAMDLPGTSEGYYSITEKWKSLLPINYAIQDILKKKLTIRSNIIKYA